MPNQTKEQIIEALWNSGEIDKAINKQEPAHLRDDLKSEMFAVLCEMPEEKIQQLNENKGLVFYMVRTMLNMIQSPRSTFYYKYRRIVEPLQDQKFLREELGDDSPIANNTAAANQIERRSNMKTPAETDDQEYHDMLHHVKTEVDGLHFYEGGLLKLWAENRKNAREVSRITGIPYRSVYPVIKLARLKVIEAVTKKLENDTDK